MEKRHRILYTESELVAVYHGMVSSARKNLKKRKFNQSLIDLIHAAKLMYDLNHQVHDAELLDICLLCSRLLFEDVMGFVPIKESLLFYDNFSWDNRGLTQQYLDALLHLPNIKLVYVNDQSHVYPSSHIYDLLHTNHVEIVELRNVKDYVEKAQILRDTILKFRPAKAFFHLTPHCVVPFVGFGFLQSITKYQINLTDHAFWIGNSSFFDYSLEFREFGCNISFFNRGFRMDQILYLPYYPWQETDSFRGFPTGIEGKKILFSGGALLKLEGGDDSFFSIVKGILGNNLDVVLLYAGDGDRTHFENFIRSNHFGGRVFLLGNRTDIAEVFKRIDIYLGTYPIGGGLMSQYAAINGKPLLIYKTWGINDVICIKKKDSIVFDSEDELLKEANRLIREPNYYQEKSDYYKGLVINNKDFRNYLKIALDGKSPVEWEKKVVPISNDEHIRRINNGGYQTELLIFPYTSFYLKIKVLANCMLSIPYYSHRIINAIKRWIRI